MSLLRWVFPTVGDVVAVTGWLLLGWMIVGAYLRQRRVERAAARYPIGDRWARERPR